MSATGTNRVTPPSSTGTWSPRAGTGSGWVTEALRRLSRSVEEGPDGPGGFDVVFLDIDMPGLNGLGEAFLAQRLEQVVDGLEVEGADREVLVGGDEDDQRRGGEPTEQAGQFEAVQAGHVDVEEDDVETPRAVRALLDGPAQPAQRLGGRRRGHHAADPRVLPQEVEQLRERGFLVVHRQDAQGGAGHAHALQAPFSSSVPSGAIVVPAAAAVEIAGACVTAVVRS
jgi:CheY-like chemotaxis protein